MKVAIIYYSKSGTTEKLAQGLQKALDADMFKVEPSVEYGSYLASIARVGKELLTSERPDFKTEIADFSDYDTVFVGFPVWYNNIPQFLQDYLTYADLSGKKIIPFATSGGSGISKATRTLKKICPDSEVRTGFVSNITGKADLVAFLTKL